MPKKIDWVIVASVLVALIVFAALQKLFTVKVTHLPDGSVGAFETLSLKSPIKPEHQAAQ